jgi:hypothetical protein
MKMSGAIGDDGRDLQDHRIGVEGKLQHLRLVEQDGEPRAPHHGEDERKERDPPGQVGRVDQDAPVVHEAVPHAIRPRQDEMRDLVGAHDPAPEEDRQDHDRDGKDPFGDCLDTPRPGAACLFGIDGLRAGCGNGTVFGNTHAGSPIASRSAAEARRAWAA